MPEEPLRALRCWLFALADNWSFRDELKPSKIDTALHTGWRRFSFIRLSLFVRSWRITVDRRSWEFWRKANSEGRIA